MDLQEPPIQMPAALTCSAAGLFNAVLPLAQECQHVLGHCVRLGQHRHTGLLQNLCPGQGRRLGREVRVENAAARCRQVFRNRFEVRDNRVETILDGAEGAAQATEPPQL
jgi:hypothetical protein